MISEAEFRDCFDGGDLRFAAHFLDDEMAFRLLGKLRHDEVDWADVRATFEKVLYEAGCDGEHIQRQIAVVRAHFAPWLYDKGEGRDTA